MLSAPETRNRPFRCCSQNPATIPELVKDWREQVARTEDSADVVLKACRDLIEYLEPFNDKGVNI